MSIPNPGSIPKPVLNSIVGVWNMSIDWGCDGSAAAGGEVTFNGNGTWSQFLFKGRWVQVGGMCFFNFDDFPGLVYTANVTRLALTGIMGYAVAPDSTRKGSGCWSATRESTGVSVAPPATAPKVQNDVLTGPPSK
jgi:hypothetical protein